MRAKQRLKGLMLTSARTIGFGSARRLGALVLCYHRIDGTGRPLTLTLEAFRRHMTHLRDHGARWMTVSELGAAMERGEVPARSVCVTFDDAALSSYEPIEWLVGMGGRCTLFPVIKWLLEGPPEWMGWDQMKRLSELGVEIGSHTVDHSDLVRLDSERLRAQLRDSRARLEAAVGREITSFAYPYGRFDAAAVRAVREAGYRWACTTQHVHAVPELAPYLIPRFEAVEPEVVAELFAGRAWLFHGTLQRYVLLKNRRLARSIWG